MGSAATRVFGTGALIVFLVPGLGCAPASAGSSAPLVLEQTIALRPSQAGSQSLPDRQLRAAFAGHVLADGSHFRKVYARDGQLTGRSLGRPIAGRWRVADGLFCETLDGDETCYAVERDGDRIRLVRTGSDVAIYGELR